MTANGENAGGSQGGGEHRRQSLSRLNILIATTAAIVGLIYGYDLGSIASALLFLVPAFHLSTFGIFLALSLFAIAFVYTLAPETKGRQLEAIRTYWYNGGRWPDETETGATRTQA